MITILVIILYGNFTNGVLYQQENEHLQLIMPCKGDWPVARQKLNL